MAVFVLMFLLGAGAYLVYRRTGTKEVFVLLVLLLCLIIFFPTVRWSYFLDDIGNFYSVSQIASARDAVSYILEPGVGHFIPAIHALYFISYRLFWVDPTFFHILIILSLVASCFLYIKIIQQLTDSWVAGVCAGALFAWSTSYWRCLETTFAHFLFCLPFILGVLYGAYRYVTTKQRRWSMLAAAAAFIAPSISSVGILTGIWVVLFLVLCIPPSAQIPVSRKIKAAVAPLIGWILGILPYFIMLKPAKYIAEPFEYLRIALIITAKSLWLYTLPLVTPWEKFSMFMAAFLFMMALVKRKEIPWKAIVFFFLWAVGYYMLIYVGRGRWGEMLIYSQRYHFYPSLCMPAIYAVILAAILKDSCWAHIQKRQVISVLAVAVMVLYAFSQYTIVLKRSENRRSFHVLGLELRNAITKYLAQSAQDTVALEDRGVEFESIFPYSRPLKWYTTILLSPQLRRKIKWGAVTDYGFIDFVKSQENTYAELTEALKAGGYMQ